MSATLAGADNPLCFLDESVDSVKPAASKVIERFQGFENDDKNCEVLRDCVNPNEFSKNFQVSRLISYVKYNAGRMCGLQQQKDINYVFFTCLLVIQDNDFERFHIKDVDFPKTNWIW